MRRIKDLRHAKQLTTKELKRQLSENLRMLDVLQAENKLIYNALMNRAAWDLDPECEAARSTKEPKP